MAAPEPEAVGAGPPADDAASAVLSVKPLEGETDLDEPEGMVRAIDGTAVGCVGLRWEGCRREDMAFGLQKLVLLCR